MKKPIALMLILALCFSLCACGKDAAEQVPTGTGTVADPADLEPVSFTVPSEYLDENRTQADYDAEAAEYGFASATLNADRSVSYVMTKGQHREMLARLAEEIDKALSNMTASGEYPNFVSITHNEGFTEFKVVSRASQLNENELSASWAITHFSELYAAFAGGSEGNCHIDYVNEKDGEVFGVGDSSEMEAALAGLVGAAG